MMWWNNNYMGWGGWTLMILGVLAVWALVAVAGVAIFRGIRQRQPEGPQTRDAARILDERFARGEIDTDEYRARRDALRAVH